MPETTLSEAALAIQTPWYVKDVQSDAGSESPDIHIDFRRGRSFFCLRNQSTPIHTKPKTP